MRRSKDCVCPHSMFQIHRLHSLILGSRVLSLVQSYEVVDFLVWLITVEDGMLETSNSLHVSERLLRFDWPNKSLGRGQWSSNFPICLTVKLVSANEKTS